MSVTETPHATPLILAGGRSAWCECRCGWVSPSYRTTGEASAAWAFHVQGREAKP